MLHQMISKFVSQVRVMRETKQLHIKVHFASEDEVLYEKHMVTEL